jgi:NitT/TauT family transport system substrate-binding protein
MFYTPAQAVEFTNSDKLVATMQQVAKFSFDHGLLGQGAPDAGFVGMAFPGGKTLGSKDNLKLRFDASYMGMAADGKL